MIAKDYAGPIVLAWLIPILIMQPQTGPPARPMAQGQGKLKMSRTENIMASCTVDLILKVSKFQFNACEEKK